jgi:type II secretory pathway component PulM
LRELPRLQAELADLEALREQARALEQQGFGAGTDGSLQASAQRSLGRDGIAGEVRAEGERGLAVSVAGVPAQAWFAWVESFARESRVRVVRMRVARAAVPGTLDAEASLEAPARW